KDNGAPYALRDIGMQEKDIDRIAHIAVQNPYWNPRPVNTEAEGALRALLQRAWQGAPPA
ncbi:MAG: maleylacetate reductase, partial [Betaproteobacteria bacterium]